MKLACALSALVLTACTDGVDLDQFVGSYGGTLTVSGAGSETFRDALTISEGSSSDLVITSQQLGAMKATVIDDGAFAIDQQQILLSDGGVSFSVTVQGQGTVTGGVLATNGTLSSSTGAFSFTITGSRL